MHFMRYKCFTLSDKLWDGISPNTEKSIQRFLIFIFSKKRGFGNLRTKDFFFNISIFFVSH